MILTLRNEKVSADIETRSAAVVSFAKRGGENIFYGGEAAPLFPFCGKLFGGKYLYDGTFYPTAPQGILHGRDFTLSEQTKDRLVLCCENSEDTNKNYPFKFCVEIVYSLEGTALLISHNIINRGTRKLIYSIGSDMVFGIPSDNSETALFFNGKTELSELICGKNGLLTGDVRPFSSRGDDLSGALSAGANRTHILAGKFPPLVWKRGKGSVQISYNDFRFTALRVETGKNGAFIHVAPCSGLPSEEGKPENIRTKRCMNVCDAGKKQIFFLSIKINT